MTRPPKQANTGRQNMDLNTCEICVYSDVPTYRNIQKPIQINNYIYYFSCEMIRRNCPFVGWVWGKSFQVDISVERLHVINMTLKDCIRFSKSEHTSEHKSNTWRTGWSSHSKLISTVYDQHKSLVFTNNNNIVSHQTWYDLRDIITRILRDLRSWSNKFFKTCTLTSYDGSVKCFLQ